MSPFPGIDEEKTKIPAAAPRQYFASQITEIAPYAMGFDTIPGFGFQITLQLSKRPFVLFDEQRAKLDVFPEPFRQLVMALFHDSQGQGGRKTPAWHGRQTGPSGRIRSHRPGPQEGRHGGGKGQATGADDRRGFR